MKSQKDLHSLFIKYLNRECTTAEIKYLLSRFDDAENETELREVIKRYFEKEHAEEIADEASVRNNLDEVHSNLIRNIRASQNVRTPIYRSLWLKAAAALLLIGLLTTFFYTYINHDNSAAPSQKFVKIPASDVEPGGEKATLTLNNGTKIVLNDAKKGVITQHGSIAVIKTKEGQLVNTNVHASDTNAEDKKPVYYTITTPRGGEYQVILPDGSKVWLNAASSLTYPAEFTGSERVVTLTGEGYFEVAKNAAMPFKVTSEGQTVRVLGTHFNVNAYTDEQAIKTTLLEGSIQITYMQAKAMVAPGEQAQIVIGKSNAINVVNDPDAEDAVAWKEGYLEFNHADIQTVMRQIARWYNVSVKYQGIITSKQYGGAIQKNLKLSQVLKILENNHLHFVLTGKEVIVMP